MRCSVTSQKLTSKHFLKPIRFTHRRVVGLLVDYVKALVGNLTDDAKEALYGGVFAMLGMCGTHETEQLNSLLDITEKALFKRVYTAYQKDRYKGDI